MWLDERSYFFGHMAIKSNRIQEHVRKQIYLGIKLDYSFTKDSDTIENTRRDVHEKIK